MGVDLHEKARRETKGPDYKSLEKLAREALHEAELAYQFVGNSYTHGAMTTISRLVDRLKQETDRAKIEAEAGEE